MGWSHLELHMVEPHRVTFTGTFGAPLLELALVGFAMHACLQFQPGPSPGQHCFFGVCTGSLQRCKCQRFRHKRRTNSGFASSTLRNSASALGRICGAYTVLPPFQMDVKFSWQPHLSWNCLSFRWVFSTRCIPRNFTLHPQLRRAARRIECIGKPPLAYMGAGRLILSKDRSQHS